MFRGLDDDEVPGANATLPPADPLAGVFKQRIEEERVRIQQGEKSTSTKSRAAAAEDIRRAEEAARAKRDSWVYEDNMRAGLLRPEDSANYKSSGVNDKYVKYYDSDARDMEYNGAYKMPPHPRQRHRCDYHLEDIIQSASDRRYPVWDTIKVWAKCMMSPVGLLVAKNLRE